MNIIFMFRIWDAQFEIFRFEIMKSDRMLFVSSELLICRLSTWLSDPHVRTDIWNLCVCTDHPRKLSQDQIRKGDFMVRSPFRRRWSLRICVYIYIYILCVSLSLIYLSLSIYIYIYIYICTHIMYRYVHTLCIDISNTCYVVQPQDARWRCKAPRGWPHDSSREPSVISLILLVLNAQFKFVNMVKV